MMDMPMNDGMKDESKMSKENYFKCPNCDAELCAKQMDGEKSEMKVSKKFPEKKTNMGNMPMGQLKSKISGSDMNTY